MVIPLIHGSFYASVRTYMIILRSQKSVFTASASTDSPKIPYERIRFAPSFMKYLHFSHRMKFPHPYLIHISQTTLPPRRLYSHAVPAHPRSILFFHPFRRHICAHLQQNSSVYQKIFWSKTQIYFLQGNKPLTCIFISVITSAS